MTEITKLNCQRTGRVNHLKLHNNPIRLHNLISAQLRYILPKRYHFKQLVIFNNSLKTTVKPSFLTGQASWLDLV